jgi:hypothetical protein
MRKLCTDELGGVKMKKKEKMCFVIRKNLFSLLLFFLASPLALHFKDDL